MIVDFLLIAGVACAAAVGGALYEHMRRDGSHDLRRQVRDLRYAQARRDAWDRGVTR